jgi:hypothetical protein
MAKYDIAILNGRVIDPETEMDSVRNVGIVSGKISTITQEAISGQETIDALGHVVAPGFIDTHVHSVGNTWGTKVALRDGLTTAIDAELGAINVSAWYDERKGRWPVNFGVVAAHEMQRMRVMDKMKFPDPRDANLFGELRAQSYEENQIPDWAETSANTLEQLNDILSGLDKELQDGALGVGITSGYMPKVTTFELYQAQKVAANYGRMVGAHVRFLGQSTPPTEGVMGVLEQLANGVALNQPMLVCHNNNFGWWEIEERLQQLRDQGYNAWSEYYPYAAGSGSIGMDQLKSENIGQYGIGYDNVLNPQTGEFLDQREYERILADDPGFVVVIFSPAREAWLPMFLQVPHMTVASDAMPPQDEDGNLLDWHDAWEKFAGHPRTAGTRARVLRMARENDVPLMHVIAQLSYWSAKHLGDAGIEAMKMRGRLQEGTVADITVFNPETVTDNAEYVVGRNGLPSTGIPFVIVNGTIVVRDSEIIEDVRPGQAIRYPPATAGRFVPLTKNEYLGSILVDIDMIDHHDHGTGPHLGE